MTETIQILRTEVARLRKVEKDLTECLKQANDRIELREATIADYEQFGQVDGLRMSVRIAEPMASPVQGIEMTRLMHEVMALDTKSVEL